MRVLEANLTNIAYAADFGRVEATVSLLVKTTGQPPRRVRVNTSQPLKGKDPLEERLISDAIRLAIRMQAAAPGLPQSVELPIAA